MATIRIYSQSLLPFTMGGVNLSTRNLSRTRISDRVFEMIKRESIKQLGQSLARVKKNHLINAVWGTGVEVEPVKRLELELVVVEVKKHRAKVRLLLPIQGLPWDRNTVATDLIKISRLGMFWAEDGCLATSIVLGFKPVPIQVQLPGSEKTRVVLMTREEAREYKTA